MTKSPTFLDLMRALWVRRVHLLDQATARLADGDTLDTRLLNILADGFATVLHDEALFNRLFRIYLGYPEPTACTERRLPPELLQRIRNRGFGALSPDELVEFALTPAWVAEAADDYRQSPCRQGPTPSERTNHLAPQLPTHDWETPSDHTSTDGNEKLQKEGPYAPTAESTADVDTQMGTRQANRRSQERFVQELVGCKEKVVPAPPVPRQEPEKRPQVAHALLRLVPLALAVCLLIGLIYAFYPAPADNDEDRVRIIPGANSGQGKAPSSHIRFKPRASGFLVVLESTAIADEDERVIPWKAACQQTVARKAIDVEPPLHPRLGIDRTFMILVVSNEGAVDVLRKAILSGTLKPGAIPSTQLFKDVSKLLSDSDFRILDHKEAHLKRAE